tara:strand:+ start:53 stop:694 length:642 start_codon:yes stop_codon:yes gene_type:complete
MIAICGCSLASDFYCFNGSSPEVFENSQLWQYNLGDIPKVYASPGATNLRIYTQVHQAIESSFDMCLVFLSYPSRINIAWQDTDGWNLESKFSWGKTEVVNGKVLDNETKEYIAKYYNEDLEILNSFVITEAMYWKLKQTGKPFYIFTNAFTDYIHSDWKIFEQPEIIHDGPRKFLKKNIYPECQSDTAPNHLSLIGQTRAKDLVLSYINKKG